MTKRLSNKATLITGGSRGIGKAIALSFAREGAALVGVHYGNNAEAAQRTVEEIEALGARAVAIHADLRQGKQAADSIWQQFQTAATEVIGEPKLDILVNNAGIAHALSLAETTEDVYDDLMAINVKAPFFLIQAAADHIRDNGRIINISTGFTRVAAPTHPAYASTKGAIETLTLALAPAFGPRGITVNAVLPGVTATDMNAEWLADPQARAGAEAMSAFGRLGQADDIADVVAFLASNEARWTTGQRIDATGGARL